MRNGEVLVGKKQPFGGSLLRCQYTSSDPGLSSAAIPGSTQWKSRDTFFFLMDQSRKRSRILCFFENSETVAHYNAGWFGGQCS